MNKNGATEVRTFEPVLLLVLIILSSLGAVIGMQLIVYVGISANTSIIGALIAMLFARIPISFLSRFKSIHRQNIVQSAISAATFGAANALMAPIAVPYILGMPNLVFPMLIGCTLAMVLDGTMLYFLFGSRIFPSSAAWPAGIATAEALEAGDKGGKKAYILGAGILIGAGGQFLSFPMSVFGIAFLGNIFALSAFAIGLFIRGYDTQLLSFLNLSEYKSISDQFVPHGLMIGAGLVALGQAGYSLLNKKVSAQNTLEENAKQNIPTLKPTTLKKALLGGYFSYMIIAIFITLIAGVISEMSVEMLIIFFIYAAFAACVQEFIVGIAAMHSGWFPAFAVALITLIVGIFIGFPPIALALLVGFCAATGPSFADMGFDLKTGFIIRQNENVTAQQEIDARLQQYFAALVGFITAAVIVGFSYQIYYSQGLFPPASRSYAATIQAAHSTSIAWKLAFWAIPGAIIQLLGGSKKQLGILLSTGLLINYPMAAWSVTAGLIIRAIFQYITKDKYSAEMNAFAGGVIAGDAICGFAKGLLTVRAK